MSRRASNKSFSYSRGDKSFNIETDTSVMNRDADNFTKKQEQERKKLYTLTNSIQNIKAEIEERNRKITEYRRQLQNNTTKQAQSNSKTLSRQVAHYKKQFDDEVANVNILMADIDQLRKQRLNFYQQFEQIKTDLQNLGQEKEQVLELIDKRRDKAIVTQNQMYDLKTRNEEEKENYRKQFEILQFQIQDEKKQKEIMSKTLSQMTGVEKNSQSLDTSSLLKRRLQKIILKNKEKVKIMEQYMRNMAIIDEAFNQIKETTGITDIQEIQNTFIKAEEQNYALLTYVDLLHQQIDNLEDQNTEVEEKLTEQEKENMDRKRILQATPDHEKFKKKVESILESKGKSVKQFQTLLDQVQPDMEQLLLKLADSKFNIRTPHKVHEYRSGIMLNESTILSFMADLDDFINELLIFTAQKNNMSQAIISGIVNNDVPIKDFKQKIVQHLQINTNQIQEQGTHQNKLLDKQEFKEIALETLEKKKQGLIKDSVVQKKKKEQI